MTPIHLLALGFVLGAITITLALLAIVGRHKLENLRAISKLEAMEAARRQAERQRAMFAKNLIDINAENEYLKEEVACLQEQKLKSWGIPDGI